jgi:pimeloyl-ACP methyl ester carboxylesterase
LVRLGQLGELNEQFSGATARVLECRKLLACSQAFAEEWSPIDNIDPATCPPELLGSDLEERVPVAQAEEMAAALKAVGCSAQLVVLPKAEHTPGLGLIGAPEFIAEH